MKLPKLRKNGDGRAFSQIPGTSKRLYFGKSGTPEARQAYQIWLAEFLRTLGQSSSEPPASIRAVCNQYLDWLMADRGRKSREYSLAKNAFMHFCRISGSTPATSIGPRLLLALQEDLRNRSYRKSSISRPYSRRMINRYVATIKRMVRWACSRELIPPESFSRLLPVENLKRGNGREQPPIHPVSISVVQRTLPFLPEPYGTMVLVQYLCGMRPAEVCAMRADWITNTGEVWLYCPENHKNTHRGHQLVKAIPKRAQELLKPLMTDPNQKYLFKGQRNRKSLREHLGRSSYLNAIKRAICRARKASIEIEDWTPLQLRHAIATDIRSVAGMEAAQVYLGHARIDVTHRYAERKVESLSALAQELEGKLFKDLGHCP